MALAQCTMWSITHYQERDAALHTKIEDMHDVWMLQADDSACLITELCNLIICQLCCEYFDRSMSTKMYVFTQVYLRKASLPQQLDEVIVAKSFPYTIDHRI